MIPNLKPYPAYQESGVPWLGQIPAHWQQSPGRACFTENKTPNVGMQETTVLSLSYGQIVVKPPEKLHGLVPASFETYQIIEPYDIVIRPTDLQNDWVSLRTGLAKTRGIITSAYMCLRTKDSLAPEYGHLLLHAYDLKKVFYGLGSGLRQNLSWRDFKYLPCLVPPPDDAAAIVRFLDYIDRRTRRYIRAKSKLIALLDEQKQAIIHRAVTRGLDPNVHLKPSGVEWLGDIPEHWEVKPLKRIAWFKSGAGFPVHEQGEQANEIPFLKVSDMTRPGNEVWMETASNSVSKETAARLGAFIFPASSIIFPKVGGALLTNKRRMLRQASCIDNNVMGCVVTVADRQFAFLLLQQLDLGRLSKPGPVPAIGEGDVREIKVALPPLDEQTAIVDSVQRATAYLDRAVVAALRGIDLIREYRTRLIADAVTGKLDVRQAAANLPEGAEEPEDWDADEAEEESDEGMDEAGMETDDEDD